MNENNPLHERALLSLLEAVEAMKDLCAEHPEDCSCNRNCGDFDHVLWSLGTLAAVVESELLHFDALAEARLRHARNEEQRRAAAKGKGKAAAVVEADNPFYAGRIIQ